MPLNSILERNLLALSSCDPELSVCVSTVEKSENITFLSSRNGYRVPAQLINTVPIPFHSKIDPIREAEKYLNIFDGSGYIVFLGLGAGYHITGFLQRKEVSNILIIEKDYNVFRALLEEIDLTSIIVDPRVKILVDEQPEKVTEFILKSYFPVIAGSLKTISLGARVNIEKEYFQAVVDAIKNIIDSIIDDYSVQAKFGRKWFINTLHNLELAEKSTISISPARKAIITGAGPSLEKQFPIIRLLKKNAILIATDTSLPALLTQKIIPDIVISIDCQQISYHHFLKGIPREVPLVLDLASPPLLTRMAGKTMFFSSGHPFSQYITQNWRRFPDIDTSGGNVSHAALSLAISLGAEEIILAGIDFSFPEGKSYARGTYIYSLFQSIENRLLPLESLFYSFLFRNKNIVREKINSKIVYVTHAMSMYKKKLEKAISGTPNKVTQLEGLGIPLTLEQKKLPEHKTQMNLFSQGPAETDWRTFINDYKEKISVLPEPYHPINKYLHDITFDERELWLTLLPLATWLRDSSENKSISGLDILKLTREMAVKEIELFL